MSVPSTFLNNTVVGFSLKISRTKSFLDESNSIISTSVPIPLTQNVVVFVISKFAKPTHSYQLFIYRNTLLNLSRTVNLSPTTVMFWLPYIVQQFYSIKTVKYGAWM